MITLESTFRHLMGQMIEFMATEPPDPIPPIRGIAVRIDNEAQGFEPRSPQFGFHHPRLQQFVNTATGFDMDDRAAKPNGLPRSCRNGWRTLSGKPCGRTENREAPSQRPPEGKGAGEVVTIMV